MVQAALSSNTSHSICELARIIILMYGVQQGDNFVLYGMSSAGGQPQEESFLKGKYSKPIAESTIST